MNLSLKGKTAVVCGSTQGIGKASAVELALLGASCVLIARDENKLSAAIKDLDSSQGQKHQFIVADFQHPHEVKEKAEAFAKSNTVNILVNNTGGPKPGPITEASEQSFVDAFSQHIVCNQILAKAVLPVMKAEAYGRIINIISTSVRIPFNNLGVSNTIRAATASWAKTLSNEVAQFGITVNSILPGLTETARLEALAESIAAKRKVSKEEIWEEMKKEIPAKRFGKASELAAVAAFLASPAASYVNGVSIPVDGGKTGTI